jgi:cytochrome c oxidase assembly factor CtaG
VNAAHPGFWHWLADWPALACYAVIAAAHLTGLARLRAAGGFSRERRQQALAFQSGLVLALLALVSPIGYLSEIYIWVRALQFLLLAMVATGLMVLGAPWQPLRLAVRPDRSPTRSQPTPAGGPESARDRRVPGIEGSGTGSAWLFARPGVAIVVVNAVWLAWQLPGPFDAVRTSGLVALACHLTCTLAGIVFWLQLIGSRPLSPVASPLRRLALIGGTAAASTVLGMVLVFGSNVQYPAYAGPAHHLMTVLDDQQLSGAVLWMGFLPPLVFVAVALLMRWFSEEESAELSAGLDRLLTPRKDGWSARPGIR